MKKCITMLLVLLVTLLLTSIDALRYRVNINATMFYNNKALPQRGDKNYYNNKGKATITKTSHFEQNYELGRKITFICVATGIPRPEITWFKNGYELYSHQFFTVHESYISNSTVKSKMEIEPAMQKDAGYYECRADNLYAIDRRSFRAKFITFSFWA